jgi:hypothetical protein
MHPTQGHLTVICSHTQQDPYAIFECQDSFGFGFFALDSLTLDHTTQALELLFKVR